MSRPRGCFRWLLVVALVALPIACGGGEHRTEPIDETYTTGDDVPEDEPATDAPRDDAADHPQ